jgi:hypothetical protein
VHRQVADRRAVIIATFDVLEFEKWLHAFSIEALSKTIKLPWLNA